MLYDHESDLTQAVRSSFEATPDARLREIMLACVSAAHDAVRRIQPTAQELQSALAFLTAVGKHCDNKHNEMVLLADVLGVSTLALLLQDGAAGGASESALLGPFYRKDAPETEFGASIVRSATTGVPMIFTGRISNAAGETVEGASVDVWHAAPTGSYDIQDARQADMNLRGRLRSTDAGEFRFRSVLPSGYPVPTHGPTGTLLRRTGRLPMRPAHIHVLIHKPGYQTLITQHFVDSPDALAADVVFGARRGLVGATVDVPAGSTGVDGAAQAVTVDAAFVVQPGTALWPEAPIA